MATQGPIRFLATQRNDAAATLARAFQDDPLMRHLFPDAERRRRSLPWFLGSVVRYCSIYGEVYAAPGLAGIACWLPPGGTTMTMRRIIRSGMVAAPLRIGSDAFRRLMTVQDSLDRVHKRVAPTPHWYLWLLGVDPSHQGRGIGSELLRPVLDRADAADLPCYLETQHERNLRFYRAQGFEVAEESVVAGLRAWSMRREPRPT